MTPLGHCGTGLLLLWTQPTHLRESLWTKGGWFLLLMAPDLDFLFPPHQGLTHSLSWCLLLGVLIRRAAPFLPPTALWTPLLSHLLLDLLPHDPAPPIGIPFFWPLPLRSNLGFFPNIPRDFSFTDIQLIALGAEGLLLLLGLSLYPKVSPLLGRVQVSTSSNRACERMGLGR